MAKKRKKALTDTGQVTVFESEGTSDSESDRGLEEEEDKYSPYRVTDYCRRYPEDSVAGHEFVVFVESCNENLMGTRDMMHLSNCFTRFVKGIKYLKKVNKYKVGVVFNSPNLANAFLDNNTFLREQNIKASIPAGTTELTGVINGVPTDMSNKKIFKALSSSKKIICVRRLMKKAKVDEKFQLVPTQSVAITFSASVSLPDYVYIKMWRLPVLPYIPPVKQCFKCLRFGHLAKFCHNSQRCSICTGSHSFKECEVPSERATCVHCKGNHLSVSGQCPIKKQKILENKTKYSTTSFTDIMNNKEKNFPSLKKPENSQELINLILSNEKALSLITESLIKVLTLNKTNNTSISSQIITDTIKETLQYKNCKASSSRVT